MYCFVRVSSTKERAYDLLRFRMLGTACCKMMLGFGRREELTGSWRDLYNEERHNLYSSSYSGTCLKRNTGIREICL